MSTFKPSLTLLVSPQRAWVQHARETNTNAMQSSDSSEWIRFRSRCRYLEPAQLFQPSSGVRHDLVCSEALPWFPLPADGAEQGIRHRSDTAPVRDGWETARGVTDAQERCNKKPGGASGGGRGGWTKRSSPLQSNRQPPLIKPAQANTHHK